MRRAILLAAVILTAILGASSALAYAQQSEMPVPPDKNGNGGPVTIEHHSWAHYHWARTSNPFNLKLGDNVSTAWDPILATASSDWSKSSVLDTTVVPGGGGTDCATTSGRVEVCNDAYGDNGWLGIAQIWTTTRAHIRQGRVAMNDTYFNTSTYNTTPWRNLVMCQEVGHTLGLDHQDENFDNANLGTCMDYTNDPSTNQHPNQHDYDQLEKIYRHLDSTTTVGQSTASRVPTGALNNRRAWGQEIFRSSDGRVSLFERDFGNGNKMLTWVRWTEEEVKHRAHTTSPSGESTMANSPEETTASKDESTTAP